MKASAPPAEVSANADIGTHEKVVEVFRSFEPGRVLDAPAGTGALAWSLGQMNFRVMSVEVMPPASLAQVSSGVVECDLNQQLPFVSESFDYVTCVEGIEHLQNPFHLIGEFARVLRGGGHLVLTTPNIMVLSSRWRYLLTGFFNKFPRPLDENRHDPSFHINPIAYPELRYILRRTGFAVRAILTNRIKFKERLFAPLVPVLYGFTRLALAAEQTEATRAMNSEIFRHLMSRSILFGQALIVVAQKTQI